MKLAKRSNGIYYVQYFDHVNNKTRRISTGTKTKKDALKFLSNFNPNNIPTKPSVITLKAFESEYVEFIRKQYSKKYLSAVELSFRMLIRFTGDMNLWMMNHKTFDDFFSTSYTRTEKGAELFYRTLKAAFNKAIQWGYITSNPIVNIKLPKSSKVIPRYLLLNELDQVLDNVGDTTLREIYLAAFYTGMRLGELTNLMWQDIDFKTKQIFVRSNMNFKTKSRLDRTIPINAKLLKILQYRSKNSSIDFEVDYVFQITKGVKLNGEFVSKNFKRAIRKTTLDQKIHFHSLRHSFASNLVQKNVPIYAVKELLGHSDIRTTQIYSQLSQQNFMNMIDLL